MHIKKHLILDIGGVIVSDHEAAPLKLHRNKNLDLNKINQALDRQEELSDAGTTTYADFVQTFNQLLRTHYTVEQYQKIKHSIVQFNYPLIQFCKQNRKTFQTSILSNNNRSNIEYYNRHIKLDQWTFQHVYSYYYKIVKPDSRIYKILLAKMHARPEECVFVDDLPTNVTAARRLGITAIQFDTTETILRQLRTIFEV